MSEIRSIRVSFALQPTIKQKLDQAAGEGQVSQYIENLIWVDLVGKGLLTTKELQDIMYD